MTWMKVDDKLHAHPKARAAGLDALGLWVIAGSHTSSYIAEGREGFVPEWFVETWPRGKTLARRLVVAGLWDVDTYEGEKGWRFHDWLDTNPSWEQEEARKEKDRERQRRRRGLDPDPDRHRAESARSHAVTPAVSHATPTRPDPTRSSSGPVSEGGGTSVTREQPPRQCQKHQGMTDAPACGPCKDARIAHDAWTPPMRQSFRCEEHDETHFGSCRGCEADRKAAS